MYVCVCFNFLSTIMSSLEIFIILSEYIYFPKASRKCDYVTMIEQHVTSL